jgi:hypothetical protein
MNTTNDLTPAQLEALYSIEERHDIKSLKVIPSQFGDWESGARAAIINGIRIDFPYEAASFLDGEPWRTGLFAWELLRLAIYDTVDLLEGQYRSSKSERSTAA